MPTNNILHKTGIPYNPQGQGIVERANKTLRIHLQKQEGGDGYNCSTRNMLNHALLTLNFLNCDERGYSVAERHQANGPEHPKDLVYWRDLQTGSWHGPYPTSIWGRDHVCIFPEGADRPIWVLEHVVRHHHGTCKSGYSGLQEDEDHPSSVSASTLSSKDGTSTLPKSTFGTFAPPELPT